MSIALKQQAFTTATRTTSSDKTRVVVSQVQPVRGTFIVPAATFAVDNTGATGPTLVGQYNYTFPSYFSIIKRPRVVQDAPLTFLHYFFICVKWRSGTTVYRYFLNNALEFSTPSVAALKYFDNYTARPIPHNFCIEIWTRLVNGIYQLTTPLTYETSIIYTPTSADWSETQRLVTATAEIFNEERFAMPESKVDDVFTDYDDSMAWLDNPAYPY